MYLILGSTGYLGSHFLKHLRNTGETVRGLSRSEIDYTISLMLYLIFFGYLLVIHPSLFEIQIKFFHKLFQTAVFHCKTGIGRVLRARNMVLDASNSSCSLPVYYVAVVWPMDGGNDVKDCKCYLANCNQDQSKLERVVFGPILIEEVRCVTGYFDNHKHR